MMAAGDGGADLIAKHEPRSYRTNGALG